MRLDQSRGGHFGGFQKWSARPLELHGGAVVDVERQGGPSVLCIGRVRVKHRFCKSKDDAGQGQQAHEQNQPMADLVPRPTLLLDFTQKCSLGEPYFAVPTKAKQVNHHRNGQRKKRPKDLGMNELHRCANLAIESCRILVHIERPSTKSGVALLRRSLASGKSG